MIFMNFKKRFRVGCDRPVWFEPSVDWSGTSFLRRTFSVAAVKAQACSLLGRLETLGSGVTAAEKRRDFAKAHVHVHEHRKDSGQR